MGKSRGRRPEGHDSRAETLRRSEGPGGSLSGRCPSRRGQTSRTERMSLNESQRGAAPPSTAPRPILRSSTNDFALEHRQRLETYLHAGPLRLIDADEKSRGLAPNEPRLRLAYAQRWGRGLGIVARDAFSWDSGLEAFSRNPSDGSMGPSAGRPSPRPRGPNLRFLSY